MTFSAVSIFSLFWPAKTNASILFPNPRNANQLLCTKARRHFSNHLVLHRKDGIFLDFPLDMLYNREDIEKIVTPFAIHEERIERHMKTITPLLTEIVSDALPSVWI